jgi:hypothetical protein
MPIGNNDYWAPGQSGNPTGRRAGSKNKVTRELFEEAKRRGYKQPVLYLLEVMHDENTAPELRVQSAIASAPYMTPKFGTIVPPRFVDESITVPNFGSIEDAENFLKQIPILFGSGALDSQTALELSALTKNWLDAQYARQDYELKLAAQGGPSEQTIHIQGGLPELPGTSILMPLVNGHNGHAIDGHALAAPAPEPTVTESTATGSGRATHDGNTKP